MKKGEKDEERTKKVRTYDGLLAGCLLVIWSVGIGSIALCDSRWSVGWLAGWLVVRSVVVNWRIDFSVGLLNFLPVSIPISPVSDIALLNSCSSCSWRKWNVRQSSVPIFLSQSPSFRLIPYHDQTKYPLFSWQAIISKVTLFRGAAYVLATLLRGTFQKGVFQAFYTLCPRVSFIMRISVSI